MQLLWGTHPKILPPSGLDVARLAAVVGWPLRLWLFGAAFFPDLVPGIPKHPGDLGLKLLVVVRPGMRRHRGPSSWKSPVQFPGVVCFFAQLGSTGSVAITAPAEAFGHLRITLFVEGIGEQRPRQNRIEWLKAVPGVNLSSIKMAEAETIDSFVQGENSTLTASLGELEKRLTGDNY